MNSDFIFGIGPLMNALANLASLTTHETAVIAAVDDHGAASRRLLALGFVPGSEVRVVRVAPLGDPIELEVRGSRFGLRRHECAWIRVVRNG